jgi:hypothetical protein
MSGESVCSMPSLPGCASGDEEMEKSRGCSRGHTCSIHCSGMCTERKWRKSKVKAIDDSCSSNFGFKR